MIAGRRQAHPQSDSVQRHHITIKRMPLYCMPHLEGLRCS